MSVTFGIRGEKLDYDDPNVWDRIVNLSNSNAVDVLSAVGLPSGSQDGDLYGEVRGRDLVAKCDKALNGGIDDGAIEATEDCTPGRAKVVYCGRRKGYLSEKLNLLRELGLRAGDIGVVTWG